MYNRYYLWQLLKDLKATHINFNLISEIKEVLKSKRISKDDTKNYLLSCLDILSDCNSSDFKILIYRLLSIGTTEIKLKCLDICKEHYSHISISHVKMMVKDSSRNVRKLALDILKEKEALSNSNIE